MNDTRVVEIVGMQKGLNCKKIKTRECFETVTFAVFTSNTHLLHGPSSKHNGLIGRLSVSI